MNELLDRLFALPPRQRVMALVGGVAFIFLLYAYFLYWPRGEQIAGMQKRLETLSQERDRKARLAANLSKARKQVQELEAALREAVAKLPDSREIPDLLSSISGLGRESGLDIKTFRQRAEKPEEFYAAVPVEVLVSGRFDQVKEFFQSVSQLERIVNVSEIKILNQVPVPDDPVVLETACMATTFRFLSEAEREKIRREKDKDQKGKKRR